MKKANGYGSISKLSGKRRRPYIVRVTDLEASLRPNPDGTYSQKLKVLGYFATLSEAEFFLAEYNLKNQKNSVVSDIRYINITFGEIWEIWQERHLEQGTSRCKSYTSAFRKLAPLHNKKIRDIRLYDLQSIIDLQKFTSKSSLNNLKIVMNIVFEWAIKNDIIEKNYTQYVEISANAVKNHVPFSQKEIDRLWISGSDIADTILIYVYTGVRPSELLELRKDNIFNNYFNIVSAKTAAGIRSVPVADKINERFNWFVRERLSAYSYDNYARDFNYIFANHTPHDTRSTFISLATEKGIDKPIIQKIVGHKAGDVTTDVYTHLDVRTLLNAVNLL